eukprot:5089721-Amphidinium_carterae.1
MDTRGRRRARRLAGPAKHTWTPSQHTDSLEDFVCRTPGLNDRQLFELDTLKSAISTDWLNGVHKVMS